MNIEAVIFDMDGVIIDSEPFNLYEFYCFAQQHGVQVPMQELRKIIGTSHEVTWNYLASWLHLDKNALEMDAYYRQTYQGEPFDVTDFLQPYLKFLLKELKKQNVKLAVASSNDPDIIEHVCKENGIETYFDSIVSGRMFTNSKPDPEIYVYTLNTLGVSADHAIVIEDSKDGIEAAKQAGMKVIAIKDHRYHIDQQKADYLVEDLFEAYQLIASLM
ncbi:MULTISPECIES: HAD family phosphatase [unclassified Breznakia]|uniref:HAD family hydrolase n=1 Tax=unclassified Breznakia TaxID=2623764 RepID=UPI0024759BC8|nr:MULTISPECIES: HAD family phosphatase [unclassified Breznakia]MDH6367951.1 HAD superfamily hydrolase (TIGR01509 family) [Breznakia sp. PH1-1]MDH6405039.1 HAD superfamily hydrolase (TIGR01509 family) [Breznakia sp. PF1-11]MDH6412754.1 HAD superfamily hydrolase (TIGR01509 family) [Breznakia sp. PFB1-11]MDH6415109.1 HAD superfamily hydrolase (TIGR01509 family) [Breznakia sp. PFB1-14]MDH6417425.1 HAD superfamily hydrolase (TIGR01509 family) [Breznakia sp. PFB1-4]